MNTGQSVWTCHTHSLKRFGRGELRKWLGKVLVQPEDNLGRQAILQLAQDYVIGSKQITGTLLEDAQKFKSMVELVKLARDGKSWTQKVNFLCPTANKNKEDPRERNHVMLE